MKVIFLSLLFTIASLLGTATIVDAQGSGNQGQDSGFDLVRVKEELRNIVDAYSSFGDQKKIHEQMGLFTPDAIYKVYMNGILVSNVSGTTNLENEFKGHAAQVKTYFTMNGQHSVKVDGSMATGVSFSQLKMVRETDGKDNITDYSVRYEDKYIRQNGKWLIKERTGYFIIVESRKLNN